MAQQGCSLEYISSSMTNFFTGYEFIKDYLLFTILIIQENDDCYAVDVCGDGVIILQRHDDTFEYKRIEYDGAPPYYAYNFVAKHKLTKYKDGVKFEIFFFNKDEYKAVGVATDGLNYILNSPFKDEFETHLRNRKPMAIKRLINREHKHFKDDISITI